MKNADVVMPDYTFTRKQTKFLLRLTNEPRFSVGPSLGKINSEIDLTQYLSLQT